MEALSEKYLEKVARETGVDKPTASKYIDTCIKRTSCRIKSTLQRGLFYYL